MRLLALMMAVLYGTSVFAASFTPLGDLPTGNYFSNANAISDDGQVVVGSASTDQGAVPFRWTAQTGMVYLGSLPGAGGHGIAYDISADGTTISGVSSGAAGYLPFRWTAGGGMEALGDLPGGQDLGEGIGISPDGSVVVGRSFSSIGQQAFRWNDSEGIVGLDPIFQFPFLVSDTANDASSGGQIIVGDGGLNGLAFRWTEETGLVQLGTLPGDSSSGARAVTPDGTVIVGYSSYQNQPEAFVWTEADGMIGLGVLPGGPKSAATGISADGSVVVGAAPIITSAISQQNSAFIWTAEEGMLRIDDVLVDMGVDLGGYTIESIEGISADGKYIVGRALNVNGDSEAYLASVAVPVPATVWLFGSALGLLSWMRRRAT